MTSDKPKGGRGHRAPYQTTHLRVPAPLKDQLQAQIDEWRSAFLRGEQPETPKNGPGPGDIEAAIAILTEALTLQANKGGAIKTQIEAAIALLGGTIPEKDHRGRRKRINPNPETVGQICIPLIPYPPNP